MFVLPPTCTPQSHSPHTHIIIEAHPDVYAFALSKGWGSKPGVRLLFGRWQEVLPRLLAEGTQLDGVFWDTYAEYYADMRDFHEAVRMCGALEWGWLAWGSQDAG
jgi:protein arginine N-methyltransferase 2